MAQAPARLADEAEVILSVDDLNVSYATATGARHVLLDVSLELQRGEILGIVGESGSGKSTLLSAILGLLPEQAEVTGGSVRYDGRDLLGAAAAARRELRGTQLRFIPQRAMTSLNPVRSIASQFKLLAKAADRPTMSRDELSSMLRQVGLNLGSDQLKRYPHEFSGGQLQRMLIAASLLLGSPSVVFADEPTSTLDTTVQAQVLQLIRDLRQRTGASIVFVTHDLGVVAQLCDRVLVMYAGEIVENAAVEDLFHDPKHPYTRALLGTLADRHVRGERLTTIPGKVSDSIGLDVGCRFAPRCPFAFDRCRTEHPADLAAGQSVTKCHLHDQPAVTHV